MGKRRFNVAAMGFILLIVLVVGFLMSGSLRRTSHVTLPDLTQQSVAAPGSSQYEDEAVNKIEIKPETVQSAIATLARPNAYIQLLVGEWLWESSSALSPITTYAYEGLFRIDSVKTDGRTRHVVTNGERTAVWYDDSDTYYIGNAGDGIKSFFDLGGHQMQINAVNRDVLLDAKAHPDNYPGLIVRVWGWSGYFCELEPAFQEHIIHRVEFTV